MADENQTLPPQQQPEPGKEGLMNPRPEFRGEDYKAAGKLQGKVAIITGGDSGIGRSVAVLFAREGADVAILYLDQHQDADQTRKVVEEQGRTCLTFAGDVADRDVLLIDDILDISKIESGKMEIEQVECSPCQIISEVISLMRVRACARGLDLDVE